MVKVIENKVEIYELNNIADIYTHIEKCGRICYKSENLITNDTSIPFIKGILKSGHESVIEHANIIFSMPIDPKNDFILEYKDIRGINISIELDTHTNKNCIVVSGNIRAFRDLAKKYNIHDFLMILNSPIFTINNQATPKLNDVKFEGVQSSRFSEVHNYLTTHTICDIGAYKDLTRHRLASFSIESTRFCNYSKGKFGSELTMIKPCNIDENSMNYKVWLDCMNYIEKSYLNMVELGSKNDEVRMLLPHSTKADMMMSANIAEWKHIFKLRCHSSAHPSVSKVMIETLRLFYNIKPIFFKDLYKQYCE